jgi:hypothetical protein
LIVGQLFDGLTTKIGLDLGLAEVGTYAMPILGTYGFLGLMSWKYSIIAGVGVLYFSIYYLVKRYTPRHLKVVTIILSVGCLIGLISTIQVDVSNILEIQSFIQNS